MNHKIKILMSTDVHGFVYPRSYATKKEGRMGFAKLAHSFRQLKDENTILIDNGDNLEGSPFAYYHFEKRRDDPNPFSAIMNAIGYDFFNLGNHDFNHGQELLMSFVEELQMPCVSANLYYKGKSLSQPYYILEKAGKKIALFGIVTQHIPNWEKPENISDFGFEDAFDCAKRAVQEIKEKEDADYIVCIYHGGFEADPDTGEATENSTGENEGYKICTEIEGIDILLTGHQHRSMCGRCGNTVYIQSGHNGSEFSYVEIDTETGEIKAEIRKTGDVADEDILDIVRDEEADCQIWLDQPLGTSKVDLRVSDENTARLHKSQVITFLNRVCMDCSGAQISANALFLHAKGFESVITMRDIVSTYPFPNTLVVKEVSGKDLRDYLELDALFWEVRDGKICVEKSRDFPTPQHHNYDMLDGVEYEIKVSNPRGHRITKLTRNGIDIKDDDIFTLCINNYRAAGGGDFTSIKNARTLKEIQRNVVEVIAEYIEKHKVIDFEEIHNIKVVI